VGLKGVPRGALTDSLGMYTITSVPAGSYVVFSRAIGYNRPERVVAVTAGRTSRIDFNLEERATVIR